MKIKINHSLCFEALEKLLREKAILKHVWPQADYPFRASQWKEWFDETQKQAKSFYLYNEKTQEVIGHFALKYNNLISPNLYLCFVVIKPSFQGTGLIEEVVQRAQDIASLVYQEEDLYLHVRLNNPRAFRAYQKCGFEILKKHSNIVRMIKTSGNYRITRNEYGSLRRFS